MRFISFLVFPLLLLPFLITCGKKPDPCAAADAGPDKTIKLGSKVEIGNNAQTAGVSYSWMPMSYVESPSSAKTNVAPFQTTVYLLQVKTSCGTSFSQVKVKVLP
jgi:hypothetical protein